ncbi:S-adenosyl-L-methionine-dependent methyltransferase [Aspergillus japonicus CBS 114.51]|uniref:S-adenosyl-L-methionine-dependent methyltransferase n=2 Tax=Aspergillus TaxID=5052 RepID=A0A2V5HAW2_ASPV1|nr:S-adenosyl-L-methionine-dependent methyltransferase [Aspergillus japonicus CBS 114.51]PYI13020.1 S-adenosyl-L-methionine-dependent methyltransferase [Aspergillus violaceofuscus CBS 115571]RAH79248.1 S-adenosyl-L-methionine-dependent methyltransferase [Aspergillus japonicus CBS 114.51]
MSPAKVSANDVPMHGNGFYSSNSALQHSAMLNALPLLSAAASKAQQQEQEANSRPFTILEFGSAHGNNSHTPITTILKSRTPAPTREIHLQFNDRPTNDFTTLSTNLATMTWPVPNQTFTSLVPSSFYSRVAPQGSVDVAFSLAALHHLDRVTPVPASGPVPTHEARQAEFRAQAHADLLAFLAHRAAEIVPGGGLVLSFVGQELGPRGEEITNYAGPVDACRAAMVEMLQAGVLSPAVANVFEVPAYNRTLADVRRTLGETAVRAEWDVEEVFERKVVHPAIGELEGRMKAAPGKEAEHAEWYARTVVDWLMAVVAGYFVKAVREGMGVTDAETVEGLLAQWVERTRVRFLEGHRNEAVECWFVYARLSRK